jgi:hypothetical protein
VLVAADIHDNAVYRVRPVAIRIAEARADPVQPAMLWLRAEDSHAILKGPALVPPAHLEA